MTEERWPFLYDGCPAELEEIFWHTGVAFIVRVDKNRSLQSDTFPEGELQVVRICRGENSWKSTSVLVSRIAYTIEPWRPLQGDAHRVSAQKGHRREMPTGWVIQKGIVRIYPGCRQPREHIGVVEILKGGSKERGHELSRQGEMAG